MPPTIRWSSRTPRRSQGTVDDVIKFHFHVDPILGMESSSCAPLFLAEEFWHAAETPIFQLRFSAPII